jgi:hypothetical protein
MVTGMMPATEPTTPEVSSLRRAFQRANDDDSLDVARWDASPLAPGLGAAEDGLRRYTVTPVGGQVSRVNTLILKIARPSAIGMDPRSWVFWKREALTYESNLLADLPDGLAAPTCYGVDEQQDGTVWIWMEDIQAGDTAAWMIDRYALAARHLGRLSGKYLVSSSLPDAPWVSRRWLASWIAFHHEKTARISEAREHPVVGPLYNEPLADEVLRLLRQHEDILTALDRLPQTVTHGDAHKGNMFDRVGADGRKETVLFDWSFTALRAVGEELAPLVACSSLFFHIAHGDIDRLSNTAFDGYLSGLRDAGWTGDPDIVRMGYLGAAALHLTVMPIEVYGMSVERRNWLCAATGKPFEETLRRSQDVRRWGLQQEPKARELMRRLF